MARTILPPGRPVNPQTKTRADKKKRGFPERDARREPPQVECGGALLSHTLSSAVPSPQPGLSFRVRKGTGRLTWAMTTAKPMQRPTTRDRPANGTSHTTDSDRGGPGTGQRTQAKRLTSIVVVTTRNSIPCHPTRNHHRTRPNPTGLEECAAIAR